MSWAQQGYQILSDYPVDPWFAIVPGVQTGTRRLSNHPLFSRVLRESGLICAAGQVLAMSPLLLHASRRAARPGHRRVVHLEFCGAQLPPGLQLFAGRPGLDA